MSLNWDDRASIDAYVEWQLVVMARLDELGIAVDTFDPASFVEDYEAGLTPAQSADSAAAATEEEGD